MQALSMIVRCAQSSDSTRRVIRTLLQPILSTVPAPTLPSHSLRSVRGPGTVSMFMSSVNE
jgi:hypothetical protein